MLEKIYEEYKERLSKSDHKIFGYLLEHEQELPAITAEDLSRRLNISTATISRFWSKIGFRNLKVYPLQPDECSSKPVERMWNFT